METFDALVLGTGPAAGQVAAKCSKAGWRVAVADPRPFGGTCALRGCNPKKVLVRAAELFDWIARAADTGVDVDTASIRWRKLIEFKRRFTEPVTAASERKFERAGIAQFHGSPRFEDSHRMAIDGQTVEARKIVIATGAVPRKLGIPGEELLTVSDDFLELDDLPNRVLFVGGGYVTFEFAHVAARAGANVTILEQASRPLERFEPELVDILLDRTRQLGIDLRTNTSVESIEKQPGGNLTVHVSSDGNRGALETDLAVHGAGREPSLEGLALDAAGIQASRHGVEVNEFLQSVSNGDVYAAGDAAASGAPPLTPVANHEGQVVARNLVEGNVERPDYRGVATAVFSVPALASVGLGERQAEESGLRYEIRSGDWSEFNSMKKAGVSHARYKLIIEKPSGKILGAHLLAPEAAETINIFAMAIRHGISAAELKSTLMVFPSFAHDIRSML